MVLRNKLVFVSISVVSYIFIYIHQQHPFLRTLCLYRRWFSFWFSCQTCSFIGGRCGSRETAVNASILGAAIVGEREVARFSVPTRRRAREKKAEENTMNRISPDTDWVGAGCWRVERTDCTVYRGILHLLHLPGARRLELDHPRWWSTIRLINSRRFATRTLRSINTTVCMYSMNKRVASWLQVFCFLSEVCICFFARIVCNLQKKNTELIVCINQLSKTWDYCGGKRGGGWSKKKTKKEEEGRRKDGPW